MDLINRQDAIDNIKMWLNHNGYSEGERNMMRCTIQMLEGLPSAQVPSYVAEIEAEYKKAVSQYEAWKK